MNIQSHITRREMLLTLATGLTVTACARKRLQGRLAPNTPRELILCGWDEVFILPVGTDLTITPPKNWSWRAVDCPDIPEDLKRAFRTTDDCKPVEGGRKILISSSSGAVALVERESRRALFCAPVANAHSIEMLPGGRIAAAASVSESPSGNHIIVFDLATKQEVASDTLYSAHGLVWDEQRQLLWALGGNLLRAYRLKAQPASKLNLELELELALPESNGHDLTPVPATPLLFLSTGHSCWYFDRDARQFRPHDVLANIERVKSCSIHPSTGRVAYLQAEGKNWWSQRINFLNPHADLHMPGERLYKARWA